MILADILVFLKFFNTERRLTEFKGTLVLALANEVSSYLEEMNRLIGQPVDTRLNLYVVSWLAFASSG
jgi:hypothetical protein